MATNPPEYQRRYMQNYRRKHRNRIIQQLGGHCVKCFSVKKLECHHINPVNRGDDSNRYDNFSILTRDFKNGERFVIECRECRPRGSVRCQNVLSAAHFSFWSNRLKPMKTIVQDINPNTIKTRHHGRGKVIIVIMEGEKMTDNLFLCESIIKDVIEGENLIIRMCWINQKGEVFTDYDN